jgi:hypothetical protein
MHGVAAAITIRYTLSRSIRLKWRVSVSLLHPSALKEAMRRSLVRLSALAGAILSVASCAATAPINPSSADVSAVAFAQRVQRSKASIVDTGSMQVTDHGDRVEYWGDFPAAGGRAYDNEIMSAIRISFDQYCRHIGGNMSAKACKLDGGQAIPFYADIDRSKQTGDASTSQLLRVSIHVIEPKAGNPSGQAYVAGLLDRDRQARALAEAAQQNARQWRTNMTPRVPAMIKQGSRICSDGTMNGTGRVTVVGFVEGEASGRYQIRLASTLPIPLREFQWRGVDGYVYFVRLNDIIWDNADGWRPC